jgi:hypothetical protein
MSSPEVDGTSGFYLGAQASLPAMCALARNIKDALPLKVMQ